VVGVDPDGERSFFTDRGASTALERVKRSWLDGVTALHVPAYSFTVEPLAAATIDAVWRVRAAGGEISIDTSSSGALRDMGPERFLELMAELEPDVVLANREEAALLGFDGPTGCKGAGLTIVRNGSEPTVVVTESGQVEEIGVPPVEVVVDTTGAGDAFAAGWLVARAADAEVAAAVRRGHAVAARVLATPGAEIDGGGAE
jgi:sugar/nucleoside kinase (ribokinase family)